MTFPIGFVDKAVDRTSAGVLTVVLAASLPLAACGNRSTAASGRQSGVTVRLGYFPNITHATAVAGVEKGVFARALGPDRLATQTFTAGPAAVEALFSKALDAAYLGPNPAINAYAKSEGKAIRIVSGAASGGAALVVRPGIASPGDLKGKKVASPQLGGTQDVALRAWLRSKGLRTDRQGGGDVSILPQENAQTLETFKFGQISGAWVPEPWTTRLVQEGGGVILVDERTLWPDGQFLTTNLVVRTEFLRDHPETVRRLLRGQVESNDLVNQSPAEAQRLTNQGIEKITGKKLSDAVITAAWKNLVFTNNPIRSSLAASAQHAEQAGLLDRVDLEDIYDLTILNEVLRSAARQEVGAR